MGQIVAIGGGEIRNDAKRYRVTRELVCHATLAIELTPIGKKIKNTIYFIDNHYIVAGVILGRRGNRPLPQKNDWHQQSLATKCLCLLKMYKYRKCSNTKSKCKFKEVYYGSFT
jgi:hypothetical protein